MGGVAHSQFQTIQLQVRIRALPINAGALHHDQLRLKLHHPGRHLAPVLFKTAELADVGHDLALVVFTQHTNGELESTVRYLGIEVDDALEISEQTEI